MCVTRSVLAAALLGCVAFAGAAQAKVHITVDLDDQTIHVEAKDQVFDWKVSSGKPGFETPAGRFGVLWMDKDHHSDEYDGAYMPDAIFFAPGFAIHGFGKSPWGHKASHGCVRLPVAKAEILFDLVKAQGAEVNIIGASPTVLAATPSKRPDAVDADLDMYPPPPASQDTRGERVLNNRPRYEASRTIRRDDYAAPAAGVASRNRRIRDQSDDFDNPTY